VTRQLSRLEVLALPPVITLAVLAQALGVSEPVARTSLRSGELERQGIIVNRIGAQWRVVTSSLWRYLGLDAEAAEPGDVT
jgi:DNA-binding FadR family transcriptional regulator